MMDVMNPLLAELTDPQREAVEHIDGPMLILAGPGSGKTRVVTHRIANLLEHGVPDRQIVALTFTNKAADEMRERVQHLAPQSRVWLSTFHRFCARLLRDYGHMVGLGENFTIYDTYDSAKALKRTLESEAPELLHISPEQIGRRISWAKNHLITAADFQPRSSNPVDRITADIYPAYQARLLKSSAVDFDDLLLHVAVLLRENPEVRADLDDRYRYVLVDEYQDTNLAQYAIVRALSIDHPNLSVTGDPDQSIYGWRGANLGNILEFEADFGKVHVVRLEQNYRSTQRILHVADQLIQQNKRRKPKALFTENPPGAAVRLVQYGDQHEEADSIAASIAAEIRAGRRRPRDFAIFYRVNALSRVFEFAMREQGVPYQMVNGLEFYQRKEIKDVLSYLHVINNPHDEVALLRIINTPARGIGKKTIERLSEHAHRNRITLLEAARESGLIESLSKRAATLIARFVAMQDRLREHAADPVEEILGHVLSESGYQKTLLDSGLEEDLDRLANIEELLTAAREFDEQHPGTGHLEAFLEQAALVNDVDAWDEEIDKATLMTMHAAKGLEFPVVHIVAVEQGLIPHERSRENPDEMEEERRLLFVGITRAMEQLQLSYVRNRNFRGQTRHAVPSSFLVELPRDEMELVSLGPTTTYPSTPAAMPAARRRRASAAALTDGGGLTTAAKLDGGEAQTTAAVSIDVFRQDMVVTHPQYGPGKILALSGEGARRTATVRFPTAGEKKFMLEHSPLRPAGG
jgi:DNA helicase-2/ATP-dependent DNA helicase PcrA